ncbi:hypothetical protein [Pseudomonas mediterranea]|uniref:hypothetical protein n=1 Tax=Pseudomonas mediterranea TaxID=183795 RepID=UPI000AD7F1A4|nr:hypothetical protein [Pseudomonas mediterranea]
MNSKIELAICILGPLVLSIILLECVYWTLNNYNTNKSATYKKLKIFILDADRGLAEQGYLWLSIITPIIYFIVFGSFAWSDYSPSLTSAGFKKFIEISTLPLALLSLTIPTTVLIARIHATHQTSVQISTTRHKNNMDAYYAHRKAMFEYFGSLKKITYPGGIEGDFYAHPRLHLRFFVDRGPANGTPEVNTKKFEESIKILSEIQEHIHIALIQRADNTALDIFLENYASACVKIFELSSTLHLPCIYENLKTKKTEYHLCRDKSFPEDKDIKINGVGSSTDHLIGAYRYTRSFLRVLCEFAGYDISFFDKKLHPAIDKGENYKHRPYTGSDVDFLIDLAKNTSSRLKKERRELNEQAEAPTTPASS